MDFVQMITKVNGALNNFIWGPIMLVFFLLVGFMFTARTKDYLARVKARVF